MIHTPTLLIPRRFHWIWFGSQPLPEQHQRWIEGWLALHPGWEHRLWTDANRPTFINEAQFLAAENYAQKADIARYEILYRHGGVYLDTDMECLRSIEPLLEGVEAFAVPGEPNSLDTFAIGATPEHPWLAEVIARLPRAMETGWGNMHQTGPRFLTSVTQGRSDVTVFDRQYFIPEPDRDASLTEAYAFHHPARSWNDPSHARHEAKLRELVREDIEPVVPPGALFILVDKGRGLETGGGRRFIPFPEQDGRWAGYPADDAGAIAELERLRRSGAAFIVFPAPMFYWLEAYPGLKPHLLTEGRCVVDNDRALIFDLRR